MIEYKSIGNYELPDRGIIYFVENDRERKTSDNDLLGSEVIIDGKKHIVKGVESYAMMYIQKGQRIGILV